MKDVQYGVVKNNKRHAPLPIGRAARIAFELETMRAECCQAATTIIAKSPLDEVELEECAYLEETLADAQRILKNTVRRIMISRINRRSRRSKTS